MRWKHILRLKRRIGIFASILSALLFACGGHEITESVLDGVGKEVIPRVEKVTGVPLQGNVPLHLTTVEELEARGVEFTTGIVDKGYGLAASFRVPGDFDMEVYQPRHPSAWGDPAPGSGG